jgi:hypothetical protein
VEKEVPKDPQSVIEGQEYCWDTWKTCNCVTSST